MICFEYIYVYLHTYLKIYVKVCWVLLLTLLTNESYKPEIARLAPRYPFPAWFYPRAAEG